MRRLLVGAVAAAALGAAALVVLLPNVAQAAAGCQVTYTTNEWTSAPGQGGFTASIAVQNLGDPIAGWTLRFAFPNGQTLTQGWSATWAQSAANVTATNLSWNANLGTGASTSIGFNGTWTGSNTKPTGYTLNGVACTGGTMPTSPSVSPSVSTSTSPPPTGPAPALHVSGNKVLTSSGATYRLLGVNRSGGEFACIQGNGIWDGPMDQASVTAMRTWKIRTVRVPLNEQCWLGVAPVQPQYGGTTYQNAVKAYVNLLIANGITPIVEMHWNYGQYTGPSAGCSDVNATCQKPMPDAQYAPSFWTGVATAFKADNAVVFDLFNEPYPERATGNTTTGWTCWRDGGTCSGISYQVAGFQSLLNAVRATGATNVVMIGGLAYSNDASQWLQYKPTDSTGNLAAFAHVYNFNTCSTTSCYDSTFAPVAAQVPFNLTEIGENDCAHGFVDTLMNWADSHSVGYLGWTWNAWDCSSGPALISDYTGTATPFGQGLKARLASVSS
jgi:endoglucanase